MGLRKRHSIILQLVLILQSVCDTTYIYESHIPYPLSLPHMPLHFVVHPYRCAPLNLSLLSTLSPSATTSLHSVLVTCRRFGFRCLQRCSAWRSAEGHRYPGAQPPGTAPASAAAAAACSPGLRPGAVRAYSHGRSPPRHKVRPGNTVLIIQTSTACDPFCQNHFF